ncbi:MAG: transposase, partial [Thermoanaerobaculaceae bacterium]
MAREAHNIGHIKPHRGRGRRGLHKGAWDKSSVSRLFVKATAEQMKQVMGRELSGLELCVIVLDGIECKSSLLVVALGIIMESNKRILGLRQRATENAAVCHKLLDALERRGMDMRRDHLFASCFSVARSLQSGLRKGGTMLQKRPVAALLRAEERCKPACAEGGKAL